MPSQNHYEEDTSGGHLPEDTCRRTRAGGHVILGDRLRYSIQSLGNHLRNFFKAFAALELYATLAGYLSDRH